VDGSLLRATGPSSDHFRVCDRRECRRTENAVLIEETPNTKAASTPCPGCGGVMIIERVDPHAEFSASGFETHSFNCGTCGLSKSYMMDPRTLDRPTSAKNFLAVLKAADTAARWHAKQRRKGVVQEPYINHLLEVAMLVAEATHGDDPKLVMAALLHDAIEDQEVSRAMIASAFGEEVAGIVVEVTDDNSLPELDRKRRQEETADQKSRQAKLVALADKISNLRAIAVSPAEGWSEARNLDYVAWARRVSVGLRGVEGNDWLGNQFDEAAADAERSIRETAPADGRRRDRETPARVAST